MLDVKLWTLGVLVLLFLAGCDNASSAKPLPKMYELPAFTLTERSEQPFDSSSMRGKVWVCDFFFATCPMVCPKLTEQMAKIHQATAGMDNVHLLSIATDETDTPKVLRNYADAFHADQRWSFVTGKKDAVFDLSIKGFKLALADKDGVNPEFKIIHSTKIALVDKQGWIRGYYDGLGENQAQESARLLADIKRLASEP